MTYLVVWYWCMILLVVLQSSFCCGRGLIELFCYARSKKHKREMQRSLSVCLVCKAYNVTPDARRQKVFAANPFVLCTRSIKGILNLAKIDQGISLPLYRQFCCIWLCRTGSIQCRNKSPFFSNLNCSSALSSFHILELNWIDKVTFKCLWL